MKNLFTLLTVIVFLGTIQAQTTFEKTYGGVQSDVATAAQQTSDGGYVIAGNTSSFGTGVYVVKTDANGNEEWSNTYTNMHGTMQPGVCQINDDNLIAIGDDDNGYSIITKIDINNGDTIWTLTDSSIAYVGGNFRMSVAPTDDGGFVTTSFDWDISPMAYISRFKSDGTHFWTKEYSPTGSEMTIGNSVTETSDGGFFVVAVSAQGGSGDIYCIRTDQNGDTLWTRVFDSGSDDLGWCGKETPDGGFAIVGGKTRVGATGYDFWLIRTDENGDTLWTKSYGGDEPDEAWYVQVSDDGGYLISGETQSFGAGMTDVWLVKTDENGDTLWTKTFGGVQDESGRYCGKTTDGGYVVAGLTKSYGAGDNDFYLLKTDSVGFVTVEDVSIDIKDLNIHPNPMNYKTTISFENDNNSEYQLRITDLTGKTVQVISNIRDNKVDIYKNDLHSGIYIIELSGATIYRSRLIVE